MSVITCPSCKMSVPPGAVFCDNCGYDLRSVAQAAQAPVPPTQLGSQGAGGLTCSTCGHVNLAGSAFCEDCGAKLGAAPAAPQPPLPAAPAAPAPVIPAIPVYQPPAASPIPPAAEAVSGRVVIQGANVTLPIPPGKQVVNIGREDPVSGIFPEIDLDPYGGQESGVGRRHARLTVQNGQIFIEDLESVNGTVVNRQRIAPRQPHPVRHGDEIRLGRLVLVYYSS